VSVHDGLYDEVSRDIEKDFDHGRLCFDRPFEAWQASGIGILLRLGGQLHLLWTPTCSIFICPPTIWRTNASTARMRMPARQCNY
jgi:hypothetical protein